ncbi:MAG: LysR family transcriptional regulator [Pseudomonadota bacterium]
MEQEDLSENVVERIRSLLAFSQTPNFTQAANSRNVSRPTLRRHLAELEDACGATLLERLDHTTYQLTDQGMALATSGKSWLKTGQQIVSGNFDPEELAHNIKLTLPDGWVRVQRHPISAIWAHNADLMDRGMKAWMESRGRIDAPAFEKLRPFLIVFRQRRGEWLLIEIGEESSLAKWLGPIRAKSEIGNPLSLSSISTESDDALVAAFDTVNRSGDLWYDHISGSFPSAKDGTRRHVNYRRLVMPCSFPDGSFAIGSLVERCDALVIDGFEVSSVNQQGGGAGR